MSKIVVVGVNHAGTAAVNTMLDNYKDNEVVVFDRNSNISYLGCGTALWIGKQIDSPEGLFYCSKEQLEAKKACVHMETEVKEIDYDKKEVVAFDKEGKEIREGYDKLILATGSLPIVPRIPGIDLGNVHYVKLFQNAQEIIELVKDKAVQNVAVVGAGYIGVELAEAMERCGKKAMLFDLEERVLAKYYDEPFTTQMAENMKEHNVELKLGHQVKELKGTDGKVTSIVTDQGEYPAELVIMAIGFRPNNNLGKEELKLFGNGAFEVNRKQETSKADVYAIGDCATVYDNSVDRVNYIALATNAVRSGIIAAHNACGTELDSIGVQGSNGISIFGLNMVSTGLTFEMAQKLGFNATFTSYEDLQKPGFIKENHKVMIRIVYDKDSRRVLGAQMASREDISMGIHMFSLAIEEKVTIDKLKLLDIFFLPHFNQPYNYITMAALSAE